MILRVAILLLLSYFASSAFGEYRAFNLRVEKFANPAEGRNIISNLDPQQYRGYYPVQQDERIYYTATWMCYGRTSQYQKICDPPSRGLASGLGSQQPAPGGTEPGAGSNTGPGSGQTDLQTVPVPPTSVEKNVQP